MDQQRPQQSVTGSVSWNNPKAAVANEPAAKGLLTGEAVKPQRRSKKSASAFRTISEVADILDVQQHVLRFWETKFSQVRPLKRGGGRRYYRPEDLALLTKIHHLLYTEGYTIKGVQKLLKEQGKKALIAGDAPAAAVSAPAANAVPQTATEVLSRGQRAKIEGVLNELKDIRKIVVPE